MLTEHLEMHANAAPDFEGDWWYYGWRLYAIKWLRFWQTDEVLEALLQALIAWQEAEAVFGPKYVFWIEYEADLCYELGYRDAFERVLALPVQAPHHKFLPISMAKGYYRRVHHVSLQDEMLDYYRAESATRATDADIVEILAAKCHLSKEQAQALLDESNEEFGYYL